MEQLRQCIASLCGIGIPPCQKRRKLSPRGIQCKVAVHHPGNANRADRYKLRTEAFTNIIRQHRITFLQSGDGVFQGISPQAIFQPVLPGKLSACQNIVIFVDQNGFDSGRTKLNAKRCFPCLNCGAYILAMLHAFPPPAQKVKATLKSPYFPVA